LEGQAGTATHAVREVIEVFDLVKIFQVVGMENRRREFNVGANAGEIIAVRSLASYG
jgi:hypothetical protein